MAEREQSIQDYLAQHNQRPKPFIWTARADDVLDKVKRAQTNLDKVASV